VTGVFTDAELVYLRSQRLGRLATQAGDGTLQNNPVGFHVDDAAGVIEIGGRNLAETRKFHNVRANGRAALVVDDIASVDPWVVRCLEIRGRAEAVEGDRSPTGSALIRLHPGRIIGWGLGHDGTASSRRTVPS
jgi:pyridoxamine 5'-phosphate oxidase family protein